MARGQARNQQCFKLEGELLACLLASVTYNSYNDKDMHRKILTLVSLPLMLASLLYQGAKPASAATDYQRQLAVKTDSIPDNLLWQSGRYYSDNDDDSEHYRHEERKLDREIDQDRHRIDNDNDHDWEHDRRQLERHSRRLRDLRHQGYGYERDRGDERNYRNYNYYPNRDEYRDYNRNYDRNYDHDYDRDNRSYRNYPPVIVP